ncbi:MAG: hypothetical protein H7281_06730 [Bacteriovorax sp.]|nr:hypothetical protein [Bacteriovorax sp.]
MKNYLSCTMLASLSLLSTNSFSSETSPSALVKVDFKNPSVMCEKVQNLARVFSPAGFIGKVTAVGDSIKFDYGIIDGACVSGKYLPFTGGVLVYDRANLSTNLGLFSSIKTKDLVYVLDNSYSVNTGADSSETKADGSVVLSRKNTNLYPCFDKHADQIFLGNANCSVDSKGNIREGESISMHKYNFTINKKLLEKALSKKETLTINYTIDTNSTRDGSNTISIHRINMQVSVMKDENNNLRFIF